ncbi:MAG: hypothetical protein AAF547_18905, partial [Actinomycetota bacterium]
MSGRRIGQRPSASGLARTAGPGHRLDRRTFLATLGALGLAACTDAGRPSSFDLGGSSQVRVFNWPDYID